MKTLIMVTNEDYLVSRTYRMITLDNGKIIA